VHFDQYRRGEIDFNAYEIVCATRRTFSLTPPRRAA